jgi:hypothetical protein
MAIKSKSKNITSNIVVPDQSLHGRDSDDEFTPQKRSPVAKKSKSKGAKKVAAATEFAGTIKDFITEFIQSQGEGKVKIADILTAWQREENQERLIDMVKLRMPTPEPIKPRKAKDPNAPKRPRSAYILFSNDKRTEVREANPDMKMPDVAKELGNMWKTLNDRKKQPYLDRAAEDKKRYEAEMAKYGPAKKPKGPKRAMTSYFFFCHDKRAEVKEANPEMKITEIAKELGRMWKEDFADEKSRKKWVKAAEKDKERYAEENAAWVAEHPEEAAASVPKKKGTKSAKSAKSADADEDSKGADEDKDAKEETTEPTLKKRRSKKGNAEPIQASGMVIFMQKTRPEIEEENPDWDTKQVIAEMKKRWSALSPEEREEYNV